MGEDSNTDLNKSISEGFTKLFDKLDARPRQQPSTMALIGLIVGLLAYAVATGRWTGTIDTTQASQKELNDVRAAMMKQEIEFLKQQCERDIADHTKRIADNTEAITLLRTRADNVDRRLSAGGIK
jgi:hypothetical protein